MNNHTRRFPYIFAAAVAFAGFALGALQVQARAEEQASTQTQSGADRVSVTLSDPARPALVKASLIDGGITVKAHEGKEVIVEARVRNHDSARQESGPAHPRCHDRPYRRRGQQSGQRQHRVLRRAPWTLFISVPVHTSLHLRAVNDGDIVVTGVDGEMDIDNVTGSGDAQQHRR